MRIHRFLWLGLGLWLLYAGSACGPKGGSRTNGNPDGNSQEPARRECAGLEGTPWSPSGAASVESAESVRVDVSEITVSGPLLGFADPVPTSRETTVRIPMPDDLGEGGSLTLMAEVTALSAGAAGNALPILVSLNDGEREWIGLGRDGVGEDCASIGYFNCVVNGEKADCVPNEGCKVIGPSAYVSRRDWEQHQVNPFANVSVNIFPTCRWEGDNCAFASEFLVDGRLRSGREYVATYALLSDSAVTVPAGFTASLKVSVVRKFDAAPSEGAIDLNLVLVGDENVRASRTEKGKRNLDALLERVRGYYAQQGVGVTVGNVRAIEWDCARGGDAFATVDRLEVGTFFKAAPRILPEGTSGKAMNIFIVSDITDDEENFPIRGLSGGIGGPPLSGTGASGLIFSSLDLLAKFNPICAESSPCGAEAQEREFIEMATTISHEMGHYLGLNHLSEGKVEDSEILHDTLSDTPACTSSEPVRGLTLLTPVSCSRDANPAASGRTCADTCPGYDGRDVFCPEALECEFNHVMWWTSKGYNEQLKQGDGNVFSSQSGTKLNFHPLVQ